MRLDQENNPRQHREMEKQMFAYRLQARTFVLLILATVAVLAAWPSPASAEEECESIAEQGIEQQENLHASEILVNCEVLPGGSGTGEEEESLFGPGAFPGSDINIITGAEEYPHVTQSESFVWSHGETVVVAYNDSRGSEESPVNYSGASISTDGGESFARLGSSSPFTGHGANYGDPVVVYNEKLEKWFAGFLAVGCGGQGIGLWTSTEGEEWSAGACAHSGASDDRESMWVDNNSESPHYGRMYISYNDFTTSPVSLRVTHSDNGTSWSSPVTLSSPSFRRNGQITGSPGSDGSVFVSAQFENGGGVGKTGQQNYMYRSTNGGETWTSAEIGTTFTIPGTGSEVCGSRAAIPPIWRGSGRGQPAVGPKEVVHYVYYAHGEGEDESDIFYVRSTNNGKAWSEPIRLNTDSSGEAQWMPSLRVTPSGALEATWYDRRNTTNGKNYQRFARVSQDNGESWGEDEPLSTALIPQPTQPDPRVQACYAGDYNYTTATETTGFDMWTDGRVSIEGEPVQKVYFHSVELESGKAPEVSEAHASDIEAHRATVEAAINPNGSDTNYHIEWGTTTAYGNNKPIPSADIGSGEEKVMISQTLHGLEAGQEYYWRIAAENEKGSAPKSDYAFETFSPLGFIAEDPFEGEYQIHYEATQESYFSLGILGSQILCELPRMDAEGEAEVEVLAMVGDGTCRWYYEGEHESPIKLNGCHFEYVPGHEVSEWYSHEFRIGPPGCGPITVPYFFGCALSIDPGTGYGLSIENVGGETVVVSPFATGLKYTWCSESNEDGTLSGDWEVTADAEGYPLGLQVGGLAVPDAHLPQLEAEAESYPVVLAGEGPEAFTIAGTGDNIKCNEGTLQGEIEAATEELSLGAEYGECTFETGESTGLASAQMNSCRYVMGVQNAGPPYTGEGAIACSEEGDAMEFKATGLELNCVKIYPQSGLEGIEFSNTGTGAERGIGIEAEITDVEYELLGACGEGVHTDGVLGGEITLGGLSEEEEVGTYLEGEELPLGLVLVGEESAEEDEPRFEAESYPLVLAGEGPEAFTIAGTGDNIKCNEGTLQGEIEAATEELSLGAEYGECTFETGESTGLASAQMNSCRYVMGVQNAGPPYTGEGAIACSEEGDAMEFKATGLELNCVKIYPQSGLEGIEFSNTGTGAERGIGIEAEITDVEYELLGACGEGVHTDGVLSGGTSLKGVP